MIKREGQGEIPSRFQFYGRQGLTAYGHLHSDRFQLRQVIQIVTCHGFNERAEVHLSALGMEDGLGHRLRWYRAQQHQVPLAYAGEGHHRGLGIVAGIICSPDLLIKGLDDVMVLGERLAQTVAENQFAVCQVAQYFVRTPLSRSGRFFYPRWTESDR